MRTRVRAGCAVGCLIVAVVSQVAAGEQETRLTLARAQNLIKEKGVAAAIDALDPQWDELLDGIATGEAGWLDVAVTLMRGSDGEASETLDAAMGEALRRAPAEVLRRLDGNPARPEAVCGSSFGDMMIQGVTDSRASLVAQEKAVAGVKDKSLRARRDACLELIRRASKALNEGR